MPRCWVLLDAEAQKIKDEEAKFIIDIPVEEEVLFLNKKLVKKKPLIKAVFREITLKAFSVRTWRLFQ